MKKGPWPWKQGRQVLSPRPAFLGEQRPSQPPLTPHASRLWPGPLVPGKQLGVGESARSAGSSPASDYPFRARRGGWGEGSKTPRCGVEAVPTLGGAGVQDGHVSRVLPEALCPVHSRRPVQPSAVLPPPAIRPRPLQASGSGVRLWSLPSHGTFLARQTPGPVWRSRTNQPQSPAGLSLLPGPRGRKTGHGVSP